MQLDLLAQAALEGRGVAVGRLPEAGDAGCHRKKLIALLAGEVLFQLLARDGPGADHGQVALEHVQELRHLVDGALADESAHPGDARVVIDLALDLPLVELLGTQVLLDVSGVGDHAAQLKHADHPASPAHALLRVDGAARRLQADGGADARHGHGEHEGAGGAECYVEGSLAYAVAEGPGRLPRHGRSRPCREGIRECL